MESVPSPTMHVTEPKNICSKLSEAETANEEVTKKLEDELLYGAEEDGDEEDALSDDSLRLRLSDDELDGDENGLTSNNPIKSDQIKQAIKETSLSEVSEIKNGAKIDENTESNENIIKPTQTPDNSDSTTSSNLQCTEPLKPQVVENGLTQDEAPQETTLSIKNEDEKTIENSEVITPKKSEESVATVPDVIPDIQESLEARKSPQPAEKFPQQMEIDASDITSTISSNPPETTEQPAIASEQKSPASKSSDCETTQLAITNGDQTVSDLHEVSNEATADQIGSAPDSSHDLAKKAQSDQPINDFESTIGESKLTLKCPDNSAAITNNSMTIEAMETDLASPELIESPQMNGDAEPAVAESLEEPKEELPQTEPTVIEAPVKGRRRRRRKRTPVVPEIIPGQEKENVVRVRRETAQKAEELIRKKYLNDNSDSELSEGSLCHTGRTSAAKATPPSLKRTCEDGEEFVATNTAKKPKTAEIKLDMEGKPDEKSKLPYIRKFFLRDLQQKLIKPTQEELEELLIQKVIETITMRDEIGKLREQAKISERNQEATRLKCQQLAKQIKDFEMVLTRLASDRRGSDKNAPPIKINRSVGLQVNWLSLQQSAKATAPLPSNGVAPTDPVATNGRKGLKVRSPRRAGEVAPAVPVAPPSSQPSPSPATIVVSKPVERSIPASIVTSVNSVVSSPTITLNGGTVTINPKFPTKILNVRSNNNNENLIDLTDEEDKSKISSNSNSNPPPLTAIVTSVKDSSSTPNKTTNVSISGRYQRVVQPVSTPVTLSQPIRVVKSADKPTPTAIVNNFNAPRLAFVMQGNGGSTRQLVLTPTASPIRPNLATNLPNNRPTFTYTGVQTIPNGSVRVVPATATSTAPKFKHPAPLPGVVTYPINPALKLPPPAPSLKISKVANGIVLSWNMALSDRFAEIASYQLYAYQEMNGTPNSALWKKVGDVRALPLPMACTLTQFSEGNNYYFAVRAVDTHSRFGQYSPPGHISL